MLVARLPDPTRVLRLPAPVARVVRVRVVAVNEVWDALVAQHGPLCLDLGAHELAADRMAWHVDRIHPGPLGHRTIATGFSGLLADRGWTVDASHAAAYDIAPAGSSPWAQAAWFARYGTPWLLKRSIDLAPVLALLAVRELVDARPGGPPRR